MFGIKTPMKTNLIDSLKFGSTTISFLNCLHETRNCCGLLHSWLV